jgi:phage-related protein
MAGEEEDYGSARITIDLDDADAVADARELGLRIARALDRATRTIGAQIRRNIQRGITAAGAVKVKVEPDLSGFNDALLTELRSRLDAIRIPVEPDLRRFNRGLIQGLSDLDGINIPIIPDLRRFETLLRNGLRGLEVRIPVVPDLDGLDARIRAHRPPDINVRVNADVDNDRLSRALSGVGGIAGRVVRALRGLLVFGAVGIAAASAAQGVGALLAALAPAGGIIAALPAVIATTQVALGTLKLAVLGVGDALSAAFAGDAKKFSEALEKLSPAAQKAVLAVKALGPELRNVQQGIQQSFFKQFSGDITNAIKNLLPLKTQLNQVATEFGKAASEGLKFAASEQATAPLKTIIQGTAQAASGLQSAIAPLVKGFLDVAAAVTQAFGKQVGDRIGQVGAQVGTFLSAFAASGRAVEVVRGALAVFRQLGAIAKNVGGILRGVFAAADASGGGLLNNLQQITGSFREFVNSARGQEAIQNLFGTVATIAAQLGPILSSLVTQVGRIAPALGPVFEELGPAITGLIDALGPAVAKIAPSLQDVARGLGEAFKAIGPSLEPLGASIGKVLEALSPLLPLAGEIAATLADVLGPVLDDLVALFRPIIDAVADSLIPVLPELGEAFKGVAKALEPLAAALGQGLGDAIREILPPLAKLLPKAIKDMTPALEKLVDAVSPLIPQLIDLAKEAIKPLLPELPKLVRLSADMAKTFADLAVKLKPILPPLLKLTAALLKFATSKIVVPLLKKIISGLTGLARITEKVLGKIGDFVDDVIGFFRKLYDVLVGHSIIPDLINGIVGWFQRLPEQVGQVVSSMVDSVIGWFQSLPGKVGEALTALGQFLLTKLGEAFGQGKAAASSFVDATVALLAGLPAKAFGALAGLGQFLLTKLGEAFTQGKAAASSFVDATVALLAGLPAKALGALAGLGQLILSKLGEAFGQGKAAASSFVGATVAVLAGLPGKALGALSSLGSRLAGVLRSAGNSALGAARSAGSSIVSFFGGLPGRVRSAVSSLGSRVAGVFRSAGSAALGAARSAGASIVSYFNGLPGRVRGALSGAGSALVGVGRDLIRGMISGVSSMAGSIASKARSVVSGAISAAKSALGINSPSKVFAAIGRDTGRGFIQGLTGTASKIKATTDKLARDIIKAFQGRKTRLDDRLVALVDSGNKRLTKLAAQRDKLAQRIADAQKFATDTTKAALAAFSLQSLTQGDEAVTRKGIAAGLQDAVKRVKSFTAQINTLARKGLRKDLLQQIIGLGPEQGAEIASVLASSTKDSLKRINSLQGQLAKASGTLGKSSADILFDAGKNAGKGFLAGLQGQRKAIEKLMLTIAKGMQSAIRKALRIKSPSRVFMRIGDMTGLGLHLGLLNRLGALQDESATAARALADGVRAQLTGLGSSLPDGGVVIPLTKAQRARQGGADGTGRGRAAAGTGTTMINNFHIREVGDGHVTAQRVINRLVLAAGVGG